MRINFEIWWQRIIFFFVLALVIAIAMFFIKEKPLTKEVNDRPHMEEEMEGGHTHPPGTPPHED